MASLIPGYEYDIFISYRQKDNKYDGWVTEFVDNLKKELEATFKEEISAYFDINPKDGLLETHDVDASLKGKLNCLVFIPVISQTYCDPKSYAWQNEFCAFNRLTKKDKYGRDIRLAGGNVGSRILPVRIRDLDPEDNAILETEFGGVLRYIEFIYRSHGVNRPLRANEDQPQDNLNRTYYRNQINKVANAIKEIIIGIKNFGKTSAPAFRKEEVLAVTPYDNGKSIIVLPFENFSPDTGQEYFSDGLTEEIITDLSQIKDLLVISRSSAMSYKGAKKKVREIANEVNVQYVLEGSVRKAGNKIRITVQLIDAFNDTHLWAEKYAGTLDDVFTIQEKVSGSVVEALKMKLAKEGRKTTSSLKAYDLYLLGRYYWNKRTKEGLELCIKYFEQATEYDDTFALAYSGLSDAYLVSADWNYLPPVEAYKKTRELAQKSIMLDEKIAEAHATLACIADNFEYNYEKAELLYKKAISLNPNYATGHQWYSDYLLRFGKFDDALTFINNALKLDPVSPVQNFAAGSVHYYARDYDNALLKFNDALKLDWSFPYLRFIMFMCYYHKGLLKEAIGEYRYILMNEADLEEYDRNAARLFEEEGAKGFINFIIDLEIRRANPETRYLAIFYSISGNKEKALDYIEYNVNSYVSEYQYLNVEPSFANLRSEARFNALLKKVGYLK